MSDSVDFGKLVEQVKKPPVGSDRLSIWGGACPEGALLGFLQNWPSSEQMPYRIWEYASEVHFERDTLPGSKDIALLERGRLFGEGGDLDLRRDGEMFLWRFVGKPEVRPPEGYDADDFWASHPDTRFHCYEETALLWGKRKGDRWYDDRVAAAPLEYPVGGEPERVQVEYKVYSRAGRVEFVWLTGLRAWKEENDNG